RRSTRTSATTRRPRSSTRPRPRAAPCVRWRGRRALPRRSSTRRSTTARWRVRTAEGSGASTSRRLRQDGAALRGGPVLSVRDGAAAGLGRVALLVRPVARADEWAREHRAEADRLALLAEPAELVRVHPAVDRRVLRRGLQVLADRDDVHAVCAQVAHRLDDLLVRLPEAHDDPALREDG